MVERTAAKNPTMRDQVVAAATRLFAANGFDATSLQEIADAIGITKQAVLHHFPSKEHIRRGVLEAILTHWRVELPRLLLSATASHERFDAVLGELYRFFAASPERARFIVREALDRPTEAKAMLRAITPMLGGVAGYIRAGVGDGADDIDPDAYVIHVMQLVIGAAAMADVTAVMLGADAGARDRYDRELTRIAKAGLFGRRAARPGSAESNARPTPAAQNRAKKTRRRSS